MVEDGLGTGEHEALKNLQSALSYAWLLQLEQQITTLDLGAVTAIDKRVRLGMSLAIDKQLAEAELIRRRMTLEDHEFLQPIQMRFNELLAGVRAELAIKVFGDDIETLNALGAEIQAALATVDGIADLQIEQATGLPLLSIVPDTAKLLQFGISKAQVQSQAPSPAPFTRAIFALILSYAWMKPGAAALRPWPICPYTCPMVALYPCRSWQTCSSPAAPTRICSVPLALTGGVAACCCATFPSPSPPPLALLPCRVWLFLTAWSWCRLFGNCASLARSGARGLQRAPERLSFARPGARPAAALTLISFKPAGNTA